MSIHEQSLDGEDADGPAEADPEVKLGDLEALRGVVKFPVRIKCATLSWNTLLQALDEPAADYVPDPTTSTVASNRASTTTSAPCSPRTSTTTAPRSCGRPPG